MKIRHISFKTIWYTLRAKKLEKHSTVLKLHFAAKWCRKHSRLKKMNNGRPAHFRDSQVLKWKRRWGSKHSRVFNHSPPNMTHGNCLHALHIIRSSVTLGVISFFAGAFLFCRLCTRLDPQSSHRRSLLPPTAFPFFPTPLSLYVWNAPHSSDGSFGGPGSLCCCPSLAWWDGYKGRRGLLSLLLSFSGPSCFLQIPLIFTSAPTREASCYRRDAAAAPAVLDLPAAELFQAFGSGSQTSVSKASLI